MPQRAAHHVLALFLLQAEDLLAGQASHGYVVRFAEGAGARFGVGCAGGELGDFDGEVALACRPLWHSALPDN